MRPILCYVTDSALLPPPPPGVSPARQLLDCIERAARAGVDWIQLREKQLDAQPLLDLTSRAVAACAAMPLHGGGHPRLLVNDRLDVAFAAQAVGVHLGENSVPLAAVAGWKKRERRADFLVGASCHSLRQAEQAATAGADYIFFGPVFPTPSKERFGPPQGLQKLRRVCHGVSIPVLAIGGITAENATACLDAGASGIAAIRMFQQEPDLAALLRRIRR